MARKANYGGVWHTHINPKWTPRSKNEALTILVPGWSCAECRREAADDSSGEPRTAPSVHRKQPSKRKSRTRTKSASRRNGLAKRTSQLTLRLETKG
jgi:hypothetical protein